MKELPNGLKRSINRRSFLKKGLTAAGVATVGTGLLANGSSIFGQEGREEASGTLTKRRRGNPQGFWLRPKSFLVPDFLLACHD